MGAARVMLQPYGERHTRKQLIRRTDVAKKVTTAKRRTARKRSTSKRELLDTGRNRM